jgi:hypothetical protein
MIRRPSSPRRNLIPYAALLLVLVVGAGGGYALAASKNKTITVCADKRTGILHLHNHGKCKRTQRRVSWNERGVQGPQGVQGPAGQPGAPAVSVWGQVATNGTLAFGQGLAVQHVSAGTYQVTITAPACAHGSNAPVITVSDGPPAGGAFPVAWYQSTGINQQFDVFTGVSSGATLTLTDRTFTVMDTCL